MEMTDALFASLEALWEASCPDLRALPPPSPPPACDADERAALAAHREERAPTPQSDDEGPARVAAFVAGPAPPAGEAGAVGPGAGAASLGEEALARLLGARTAALLGPRRASWAALGRLLGWLVRRRLLAEAALADGCLALYRRDWPPVRRRPLVYTRLRMGQTDMLRRVSNVPRFVKTTENHEFLDVPAVAKEIISDEYRTRLRHHPNKLTPKSIRLLKKA